MQGCLPGVLGPAPVGHQAVPVHVEQPVLGGGEPLPEEGVVDCPSPDVGDPPDVSEHLDGVFEALEVQNASRAGQSSFEVLDGSGQMVHCHRQG